MMNSDDLVARVDFAGIHALSSRAAGYSVAAKCLQVQADAESRDPLLRLADRVVLHDDAKSWFVGALGEIEVGRMLDALGPRWFVRHAVPIGAGTKDVDHLVIGPGGVFAINTKHHAGASVWVGDFVLRVNNSNTQHLRSGQRDAVDVARRLTEKLGSRIQVRSVVAVLNARSVKDSRSPEQRVVMVIDAKKLVGWLLSLPQRLSDTELALIGFAAEEPETWHVDPRAADTFRVMQRFERLVNQVGTPPDQLATRPRPIPSRVRTAARIAPNRRVTVSPSPIRATPRARPTIAGLIKLWLTIWLIFGLTAATSLVFQTLTTAPCTTATSCLLNSLNAGLLPLISLGIFTLFVVGFVKTIIWIAHRLTR